MRVEDRPEYFECACCSGDHVVRVQYFPHDKPEERFIIVTLYLPSWFGLWGRIWRALKYVLRCDTDYDHYDSCLLEPEEANRLRDMLNAWVDDMNAKVLVVEETRADG